MAPAYWETSEVHAAASRILGDFEATGPAIAHAWFLAGRSTTQADANFYEAIARNLEER